jgi:hypothetical protein
MTKKVDEKQKALLLEKIYAEHPALQADALKKYCIEKCLEAYLLDPDTFNKKTTELMKKEKKKLKKDDDNDEAPEKPVESEIVCITKIPAEENAPQNLTITDDGMIKPA